MGYTEIPQEVIQEILDQTDIVEIISSFVSLKLNGANYWGLCPFHQEKSPSFSVSAHKKIFKCFGCGAGGNVIQFLRRIENRSFPEVVRTLADRLGISISKNDTGIYTTLLKLHSLAARFYQKELFRDERAFSYVKSRGLDDVAVSRFLLGYAPDDWGCLLEFLKKEIPFDEESFLQSSLFSKSSKGNLFDRFRNRLMFPIHDSKGRIIAFGGRVLEQEVQSAKYLNSSDSLLFEKGKILYNYHHAVQSNHNRQVIVVEGYMDVIGLWQAGIENVVAPLGTGFTKEQVQLLESEFKQVILLFDGDFAGGQATLRALERLMESSLLVLACRLEDGMDPQEFYLKYGKEKLLQVLSESRNAIRFYCEEIFQKFPLDQRESKKKAYIQIREFFRNLDPVMLVGDDRINESDLVHFLSNSFQVDEGVIREQFFPGKIRAVTNIQPSLQTDHFLELCFNLLLLSSGNVEYFQEAQDAFRTETSIPPLAQELMELILQNPGASFDILMSHANDELSSLLAKVQMDKSFLTYAKGEVSRQDFCKCLRDFKIQSIQKRLNLIAQRLSLCHSEEEKRSISLESAKLLQERARWLKYS